MLCQNQNFGDPHGCLVSKNKPFGKQKELSTLKKNPEPFRTRFENAMGNPFFDFVKLRSKCSPKKFRIVIIWYFMR